MHLDHLALATPDPNAALASLVGDLGATVLGGGDAIGFRWVQVFLGHDQAPNSGMKLELITPWEPENNDFLQRFIARHGEGPHHLTFKVSNLAAELSRLRDLGFEPVGVNLSNPEWREAFLLPRQSHGTVVQLAESSIDPKFAIDEYRREINLRQRADGALQVAHTTAGKVSRSEGRRDTCSSAVSRFDLH